MKMSYSTVIKLIEDKSRDHAQKNIFWRKVGDRWSPITWKCFHDDIQKLAYGLNKLGVKKKEFIAIYARTRYEWELCEKACFYIGAAVVGIDPRASTDEVAKIVEAYRIRYLFIENLEMYKRIPQKNGLYPLIMDLQMKADAVPKSAESCINLMSSDLPMESSCSAESTAIIVQTSGTTGEPKAIPYTHSQLMAACESIAEHQGDTSDLRTAIGWLPLSNLTAKAVNLYNLYSGIETYFVSDPRKIVEVLQEISPDYLLGVPRLFEKIYEGFLIKTQQSPSLGWYFRSVKSLAYIPAVGMPLAKLFSRPIQKKLFGKSMKIVLCGSAPLSRKVLTFYQMIGIRILCAYAMSENIVPMAMETRKAKKLATVGKPLKANDVTIEEDNELLVRGKGVFKGYLGRDNLGLYTDEGYYKTGDLGYIDEEGYLTLVGRKENLIKTSTGVRISPEQIENLYKSSIYIQDIIVIGNNQKYLTALLTLNSSMVDNWLDKTGIAKDASNKQAKINELITAEMGKVNKNLSGLKQVKKYTILDKSFSEQTGELSRAMKLRRKYIMKKYEDKIRGMYDEHYFS